MGFCYFLVVDCVFCFKMDIKLKFDAWMRENTMLAESSILLYNRVISEFLRSNVSSDSQHINKFIIKKYRDSRNYYAKYAFKHYLNYLNDPDVYKNLVSVRRRSRKKLGKYVPGHLIRKIIKSVPKAKYRDVAVLQYATGARAKEILTLRSEDIDFGYHLDVIRVRLIGKRDTERVTFLSSKYEFTLKKYTESDDPYLFFSKSESLQDPTSFQKLIERERTYYYRDLQKALKKLGISGFGTHDFRRNVADRILRSTGNIHTAQKVLGHKSINTTLIYVNDNSPDIKDAVLEHQRGI